VTIAIAAVVAALIGAAGPLVLRRLPEPPEPDEDKILYSELAGTRGLAMGFALGAALMAALVAWQIDAPELLPIWVLIAGVGAWLTFIDWHTQLLPFLIVAPAYVATLALVGLGALLLQDPDVLIRAAIANVVVYSVFLLLYWGGSKYPLVKHARRVKRIKAADPDIEDEDLPEPPAYGAFGYGDVRLSGMLALGLGALGVNQVYLGIYAGFVLGGVLGLLLSRLHIVEARSYAFGPYMVLGAVLGAAWAPTLYGT
jgi:leader peptidase (prepilin peptidase)/N-methyltransferase